MEKILVVLMLAIGAISFSAPTQNVKKSRADKSVNENAAQNLSFGTITVKLKGTKLSKTDKNKIELEYENFKATGNNKKVYLIGDAIFNYKAKILDKLGNCVKIFEDKNLTINTMTFVQMLLDKNLENAGVVRKTDIFNLKPDYLEKSQAERDKK